jgi:competence protein ComEC
VVAALGAVVLAIGVQGCAGGDDPSGDDPSADPSAGAVPDGTLEVRYLDVGQGDATLLRTTSTALLIDTGRHDRDDVVPHLRALGVDRLDVVVVTHPHADHLGQFDRVLAAVDVAEVWWSGATHTTATFDRALTALERSDADYWEPRAGEAVRIGDLEVEVVHPVELSGDLDDDSVSVRVTFGAVRFLFTGDASTAAEGAMIAGHPDLLPAEVLQLGHHGSVTSTGAPFLDAVEPDVAIWSAAADSPYGHPHREVLARLDEHGIPTYGTGLHGTITVTTDGATFEVATERGG